MGSGTAVGKIFPTDTKSLIATVLTGGAYNVWRGIGQAYSAADPLGQERAKKALEQQTQQAQQAQQQQADAQAAALKAAPVQLGAQTTMTRQRFLAGFAKTINTSPLGLSRQSSSGPATLRPGASLIPGATAPKPLLGQ